ncbi:LPS export ABC transporter periplasmic protein LptC [Hymenobacter latericus]|uniref:LPS export ABC transporter periplasmic protein LptC n=1 Tax=Hymenobacter sp. YIM 151858-1 TaxID=2987688 RepID=UPI00222668DC|nr:LPS export ABC transporter periplasmic protein LptC [Hymenobacter sp. YIM 151858-1]UYZ58409.1 LPS export ABC transporter periplasmic protein LptC [Hymenobacter sp. YIM 151858-1]
MKATECTIQAVWGALLLGAALGLGSCQEKAADPVKKVVYAGPTLETSNVTTLFSDSARLQVRLTAPLEQTFENGDLVYPKGMNIVFYAKDGTTVVNTLQGDYGKYTRAENVYFVRGDVRVRNEQKQQGMRSEELYYDRPKARIYTKKFVRVETPTEILTGHGLEANEDFSRYKILKPEGVFTIEQGASPAGSANP